MHSLQIVRHIHSNSYGGGCGGIIVKLFGIIIIAHSRHSRLIHHRGGLKHPHIVGSKRQVTEGYIISSHDHTIC